MTFDEPLVLDPRKSLHLIGIGGVGMSALAGILARRGFIVSGSDNRDTPVLGRLRDLGVHTIVGQTREGATGADQVVISTAIRPGNPELDGALERGQPVYHRSQLLAALIEGQQKVAVTGSHGKTTTAAMLGRVLIECGRDPTVIVGGDCPDLEGGNYHLGEEPVAVFEACESDGSFLRYGPCSEVITSLEADHLDQHGCFENLRRSFADFIHLVPQEGFLAWGGDCSALAELAPTARGRLICFGLNGPEDLSAADIVEEQFGVTFRVLVDGAEGPACSLAVPGRHNVTNALATLAAARELGVPLQNAAAALGQFRGVGRRFELIGNLGDALVVDDYAHHPTEVAATLQTARHSFDRRIIAIFQPHLFSRTRDFLEQFAQALTAADAVIVNDIYAAREDPIEGVSAAAIADRVRELAPGLPVSHISDKSDIVAAVRPMIRPGDLVITLGAGDIRRVAEALVQEA